MIKTIFTRMKQKHRTIPYPDQPAAAADLFRGYPRLSPERCPPGCSRCVDACPYGAIRSEPLSLDMGKCIFCPECRSVCPHDAISFTNDTRMAANRRQDLVITGEERRLTQALESKMLSLFGRSLKLREVSAGGCNACEADTNVLSTVVFDLGRFGVQFVASPRHADGIFVTGPVPENMRLALLKTYEAIPEPKIVIASGACAINGGPFAGAPEQHDGTDRLLPVDLYIPGCPPHPLSILDGLLRLLDRLGQR